MSILTTLLPTLLLLILILTLRKLAERRKPHLHRLTSTRSYQNTNTNHPGWIAQRQGFSLSIYTTSFNSFPKALISRVGTNGQARLKRLYDVGTGLGVLGMIGAMGGAFWAWASVWMAVWEEASAHASASVPGPGSGVGVLESVAKVGAGLLKRGTEGFSAGLGGSSGGIQPLIPGITIPLSHLPTLILSLILVQLFHEAGHALAAALENIEPTRLSFNLHFIIPSAMVSFPGSVDYLPPNAKMRLATSGPVHNLLTYAGIWFLTFTSAGGMFWRDRGGEGRVVHDIDPRSPLAEHLALGSLVTHLDDTFLGGRKDVWTEYLTGPGNVSDETRGWCVESAVFTGLPESPCAEGSGAIIFDSIGSTKNSRCLAPHPLLDIPSSSCPCGTSDSICVRPASSEHILRLRIRPSGGSVGVEKVVLWSGDRSAVLAQVIVGTKGPRSTAALIYWGVLFLQYTSSISLSLFLLNLLPLPQTDGAQLLQSLLSSYHPSPPHSPFQSHLSQQPKPIQATLTHGHRRSNTPTINVYREYDDDSDDEESGLGNRTGTGSGYGLGRREEVWKRRLRRGVQGIMMGICVGWGLGWGMLALLRSS